MKGTKRPPGRTVLGRTDTAGYTGAVECFRLRLAAPLFYTLLPGNGDCDPGGNAELLIRREIAASQAWSIEPLTGKDYLEEHAVRGTAENPHTQRSPVIEQEKQENQEKQERSLVLPAGDYWFTQTREILNDEGFLELAAELQKEGLWQRVPLGATVYFRTLREHGFQVSQIFRPVVK